ncbi:MAG: CpaE family protein [Pseudomonadota bacterium]
MSNLAHSEMHEVGEQPRSEAPRPELDSIRPVPRVSIQAFCETEAIANSIENASGDRRMAKAHVKVHMGGILTATDFYSNAPTPNLIVVESKSDPGGLIADLERLAQVCDAGSKVVVIGHENDVQLYRELTSRGVSEYLVAPVSMADIMKIVSELFVNPEADPLGQSFAFVGAKGGVGSSTIAHNVAWTIADKFESDVILGDFDLAFGTANINFDQDPAQGMAEAVMSPDRVDDTYLDRILAKCSDHLNLLAAPSVLDRPYDFGPGDFTSIVEVAQRSTPNVVMDIPHLWSGWSQQLLSSADKVIVTAVPDLANLRNTKNLIDKLKDLRPNDSTPYLVLNQCNVSKRPEISVSDFCEPLEIEPLAVIPFEPNLFGTAGNNGQMISEMDPKHAVVGMIEQVANIITGRTPAGEQKKASGMSLLQRFRKQK